MLLFYCYLFPLVQLLCYKQIVWCSCVTVSRPRPLNDTGLDWNKARYTLSGSSLDFFQWSLLYIIFKLVFFAWSYIGRLSQDKNTIVFLQIQMCIVKCLHSTLFLTNMIRIEDILQICYEKLNNFNNLGPYIDVYTYGTFVTSALHRV